MKKFHPHIAAPQFDKTTSFLSMCATLIVSQSSLQLTRLSQIERWDDLLYSGLLQHITPLANGRKLEQSRLSSAQAMHDINPLSSFHGLMLLASTIVPPALPRLTLAATRHILNGLPTTIEEDEIIIPEERRRL